MKYIRMKKAASLNSRRYETSKVWFVRIADVRNIIGRETSGYMNVKNAVFAPPCGAERLCMAQNCHSDIGLSQCTCLHRPKRVFQPRRSSDSSRINGMNRFGVCFINCGKQWEKGTNNTSSVDQLN